MTGEDLRKQISKPQVMRLQQIFEGLRVGDVLGDRVLVKAIKPLTKGDKLEAAAQAGKPGGIYLPEDAKERNTPLPTTGFVLKIGDKVDREVIREGSMVMFGKYSGVDVMTSEFRDDEDKEKYSWRIMDTHEILCTLEAIEDSMESVVAPVIDEMVH
jgi:co-chaperonin GroES (HSP10)